MDVLKSNPLGYEIHEIKSTAASKETIKKVLLWDVAFQSYGMKAAGYRVDSCFLWLLNSSYARNGRLDLQQLFSCVDVTDEIQDIPIEAELNNLVATLDKTNAPKSRIGLQCFKCALCDEPCLLKNRCWKNVSEKSVFGLTRITKKKAFDWYHEGKRTVTDLTKSDFAKSGKLIELQKIQWECEKSDEIHIDHQAITFFLDQIRFPLFTLDFETFRMVVPLWKDSCPGEIIPFQFSAHSFENWEDEPTHDAYLLDGMYNPFLEILEKLFSFLGKAGTILSYNMTFEKTCLRNMAKKNPQYQNWVEKNVVPRMVDLWMPFKNLSYYNPKQNGSTSMKTVLPLLTGASYKDLPVANGLDASENFYRAHFLHRGNKRQIRSELQIYCALDTLGLMLILRSLKTLNERISHENQRTHQLPAKPRSRGFCHHSKSNSPAKSPRRQARKCNR